MVQRLWQWFKTPSNSPGHQAPESQEDLPPLTEADFEFLFNQLLEGVSHGWQSDRIVKFIDKLRPRARPSDWVAWLNRFGEKALESPAQNRELAQKLLLLGQQTRSHPSTREFGQTAHRLGLDLINKGKQREIWEYDGPDFSPEQQAQMLTPEQFLAKLQQEPQFAQQVAQQLGLDTTDPNTIIEQVLQQITGGGQFAVKDPLSLYNEGLKQVATGNIEAAIAAWDKTIALQPDFPEAWYNRGCALGQLQQPQDAIASYDQAVTLKPDYVEAWFNRGTMLFQLGRLEEAIASYDQAIDINPDDAAFWYHRGNTLNELGRLEDALETYNKAIAIAGVFPAAVNKRDEVQAKLNRLNDTSVNEPE